MGCSEGQVTEHLIYGCGDVGFALSRTVLQKVARENAACGAQQVFELSWVERRGDQRDRCKIAEDI